MFRKKAFRLSLALLALAAAVTATPKNALASSVCPFSAYLQLGDGSYDQCALVGNSNDCSQCWYLCPLEEVYVEYNFCAD